MTAPKADDTLDALIATLWNGPATDDVYAILDCARDPSIHRLIHQLALDYTCLFRGPIAPALDRSAPYLVHLYRNHRFTTELLRRGWGKSWGIFIRGGEAMEALRIHFRRFLRVKDEQGKRLFFRYYDPRVLRVFLPTCNAAELRYIFGRAGTLCAEREDAASLLCYREIGGQLVTEELPVTAAAEPGEP
ncbi:MAG TPA: DUF4123 domain-containing protein [Gemmatimonadaceae bacterium]|nr:DUF4123 domain-containing protein [Gemmatimonadaceae bacterium]